MALQVRRGTNAERLTITPAEGELIYVTDTKQLYVGDGTTQGGTASIANTIDSLLSDTTPQLGGNLDLNNYDITGTGNINITGTINATGNINLGDGAGGDVITIGGTISGNLEPDTTLTRNLGSNLLQWKEAWISQLNVDSQITAERIQADLIADDSTVVFNAATGQIAAEQVSGVFTGNVIGNVTGNAAGSHTGTFTGVVTATGTLDGDLTGSVFADDSSVIIEGNTRDIFAGNITSVNNETITAGAFTAKNFNAQGQGQIVLRREIAGDQTNSPAPYGAIQFDINDDNGQSNAKSIIQAGRRFIRLVNDANDVDQGTTPQTASLTWYDNKLLVGARTTADAEILQVTGSAKVSTTLGLGIYADATARDAGITSPLAGQMIFVTDVAKFQGYDGSAWVNLN
jgi:hypothetical protein